MKQFIELTLLGLLLVVPGVSLAEHGTENISPELTMITEHKEECHLEDDLLLGKTGDDVKCLQEFLHESGKLAEGLTTGYFGALTQAALKAWQLEHGLPSTGYFGPLSKDKWKEKKGSIHKEEVLVHHETMEVVSSTPAPTVALELFKDAKSGYNAKITTTNFTLAPEHASGAHVGGEGHMHIYVNEKKVARVYGNWFHVPGEFFKKGENEVKVTLNANTHADYTLHGKVIHAEVKVTQE